MTFSVLRRPEKGANERNPTAGSLLMSEEPTPTAF